MAEKKIKFWNLRADALHIFKIKAWNLSDGTSEWTDNIPIRTSGILPIQWVKTATIVAKPLYFFRCIRVTWTPLLEFSLRFSHYVLFRKDTTEPLGFDDPTDAELLASGQAIVDGTLVDNPHFLKETGKFPQHTDQVKVDAADDTDNGVLEEHQYHYWVWAVDVNGQTSYMPEIGSGQGYLGPDNAEFGIPSTPTWPDPDRFETEVLVRNSWWCNVKVVWECVDGAEGYWIQMKEKDGWFWSLPYWVEHDPSKATDEFPHQQSVVLNNFLCDTWYEFKIRAVNVPLFLVSEWSEIGRYETEKDPYPPNEIMNVSSNRLRQNLFFKGEYIRITWDWPAGAIILQQVEYFRIYKLAGTILEAENIVNNINKLAGVSGKLAPYQETTQISGTQFIDDDIVKLPAPTESLVGTFSMDMEGATDAARWTGVSTIGGNYLFTDYDWTGVMTIDEHHTGSWSLKSTGSFSSSGARYTGSISGWNFNEGWLSLWVKAKESVVQYYAEIMGTGSSKILVQHQADNRIRFQRTDAGGVGLNAYVPAAVVTQADIYNNWVNIVIRWSVTENNFQIRINNSAWYDKEGTDVVPSISPETGTRFTWGGYVSGSGRIFTDDVAFGGTWALPTEASYYHYWVTAVDTYGLESLATMPDVTIDKPSDAGEGGVHGQTGTGESYDRVSFEPPEAPDLVSPLSSEAPGFNLALVIFWYLFTVKMTWGMVDEATYYKVKIRIKPPGFDWGPWMYTARIEEAYADVDENNNPFFVYPFPLAKHTHIQWAVVTGNMAGETESDTSDEIEILEDTEPPSKPSTPIGRCYGIWTLFGANLWAAVWLRWKPNPPYQGVVSYAIFEDGDQIATVPHFDALAHFNIEHSFLRFGAESAASHDYSIRAIAADGEPSEVSDTVTILWQDWWIL